MSAAPWPNMRSSTRTSEKAARDARRRKRLKVSLPLHIRPFDARFAEIEDVGQVIDFTRDGLYFTTSMPHYSMGMRLMITFPLRRQSLGSSEVSRLDRAPRRPRSQQCWHRCQILIVALSGRDWLLGKTPGIALVIAWRTTFRILETIGIAEWKAVCDSMYDHGNKKHPRDITAPRRRLAKQNGGTRTAIPSLHPPK